MNEKRNLNNNKSPSKLIEKIFILYLIVTLSNNVLADSLTISNVVLTGQNSASDYTLVQFDISWNNSWRTSDGPSNWDATWIFIKYR